MIQRFVLRILAILFVVSSFGHALAGVSHAQDTFDPYQTTSPSYNTTPAAPTFAAPDPLWSAPAQSGLPATFDSYSPDTDGWLPPGTIFPEYLADQKASRLSGQYLGTQGDASVIDGTLGGKVALFRQGSLAAFPLSSAFEVGVEGSSQVRLDLGDDFDVRAVDFRAGVPIAIRRGAWLTRFGYYHLSSHLGDEFLIANPTFNRLNYSRDALFFGVARWLTPEHRVYGEGAWAFYHDVSEPFEFKFGIERAPRFATGMQGSPFWALHGHLREEVDFGGHFTAQAGWAWKGRASSGLFRAGLNYFNGKSLQYSFFDEHEHQLGVGLWYDY